MKETNVTIISNNINRNLLTYYKDYFVIDKNFTLDDLVQHSKVIFFNILYTLTDIEIKELYNFLNDYDIKFINFTNNIDEALLTNYLIIYSEDKVIMEGNTIDILKREKDIRNLGLKLPFYIELSNLLKDYGLIDKTYIDKESLAGALWK